MFAGLHGLAAARCCGESSATWEIWQNFIGLRAKSHAKPTSIGCFIRGATAGQVRGYILFRQETPIAYMYCRARGCDLVFEKTGFDPLLAAHSPGFVILWFALQRLFTDGEFRRFDFGEGEYPHKEHMATGSVEVAELYCFPWGFRNGALVAMHSAVVGAAQLLAFTLEIFGLKQRLKRVIRRGIPRALRSWSRARERAR
jgi:CelD/BcsL family acetyltransferase involved in cellulose biosynthesis